MGFPSDFAKQSTLGDSKCVEEYYKLNKIRLISGIFPDGEGKG